jgi:hypothetical protein
MDEQRAYTDELRSKFDKLLDARPRFLNQLTNASVSKQTLTLQGAETFVTALKELCEWLSKKPDIVNILPFVSERIDQMLMIKDVIAGKDRRYFSKIYSEDLQKALDKHYKVFSHRFPFMQIIKQKQANVTQLFAEFAKGVTYFATEFQELRRPIYHRDVSCGSALVKSELKFVKTLFGPDKSKYVERCLIERQIYDELYRQILGFQNIGHLLEIKTIENIYQSLSPNTSVDARVAFHPERRLPNSLTLTWSDDSGLTSIEVFRRRLDASRDAYDPIVECTRYDVTNKRVFMKRQTFESEVDEWHEILYDMP